MMVYTIDIMHGNPASMGYLGFLLFLMAPSFAFGSGESEESSSSLFNLKEEISFSEVCWCFLILLTATIVIETFTEWIEWALHGKEHFLVIVNKVYKELMILGLISFLLFCSEQGPLLDDLDHSWIISFEFAHILLFFVGVSFCLFSVVVCVLVSRGRRSWDAYERYDIQELTAYFAAKKNHTLKFLSRFAPEARAVQFRLLKRVFVRNHKLPAEFHFQEYVHSVMLNNVDQVLDVEWTSWLAVALFTLAAGLFNMLYEWQVMPEPGESGSHSSSSTEESAQESVHRWLTEEGGSSMMSPPPPDDTGMDPGMLHQRHVMGLFVLPGLGLLALEIVCLLIIKNAVTRAIIPLAHAASEGGGGHPGRQTASLDLAAQKERAATLLVRQQSSGGHSHGQRGKPPTAVTGIKDKIKRSATGHASQNEISFASSLDENAFENAGVGAVLFILMMAPLALSTLLITPRVFQIDAMLSAVANVHPEILGDTLEKMMANTAEMRAELIVRMRELIGKDNKDSVKALFDDMDANKQDDYKKSGTPCHQQCHMSKRSSWWLSSRMRRVAFILCLLRAAPASEAYIKRGVGVQFGERVLKRQRGGFITYEHDDFSSGGMQPDNQHSDRLHRIEDLPGPHPQQQHQAAPNPAAAAAAAAAAADTGRNATADAYHDAPSRGRRRRAAGAEGEEGGEEGALLVPPMPPPPGAAFQQARRSLGGGGRPDNALFSDLQSEEEGHQEEEGKGTAPTTEGAAREEEGEGGEGEAPTQEGGVRQLSAAESDEAFRWGERIFSRKMQAEMEKEVATALVRFYHAFSTKNLTAMEALWLEDETVQVVNPGQRPVVGYEAVLGVWGRMFASEDRSFRLNRVVPHAPVVHAAGLATAVVTCEEIVKLPAPQQVAGSNQPPGPAPPERRMFALNVFQKQGGRWRLAHHQASKLPEPTAAPPPPGHHPQPGGGQNFGGLGGGPLPSGLAPGGLQQVRPVLGQAFLAGPDGVMTPLGGVGLAGGAGAAAAGGRALSVDEVLEMMSRVLDDEGAQAVEPRQPPFGAPPPGAHLTPLGWVRLARGPGAGGAPPPPPPGASSGAWRAAPAEAPAGPWEGEAEGGPHPFRPASRPEEGPGDIVRNPLKQDTERAKRTVIALRKVAREGRVNEKEKQILLTELIRSTSAKKLSHLEISYELLLEQADYQNIERFEEALDDFADQCKTIAHEMIMN